MSKFCIGKASRYKELDVVKSPPYQRQINLESETHYQQLRISVFHSFEAAAAAAKRATEYNPVGFVVLVIEDDNS